MTDVTGKSTKVRKSEFKLACSAVKSSKRNKLVSGANTLAFSQECPPKIERFRKSPRKLGLSIIAKLVIAGLVSLKSKFGISVRTKVGERKFAEISFVSVVAMVGLIGKSVKVSGFFAYGKEIKF